MITILRAAWDESRRVFLDGGVVLISFLAVILYSFFYPVPYTPEVLHDVPVALVDQDASSMSRTLARMMDTHESVSVAVRCASVDEAWAAVRKRQAYAVVVVPKDLERDILTGHKVQIPAFVDGAYLFAYSTLYKGLLEAAGTLSAGVEITRFRASGLTADAATNARQPITTDYRPLFSVAGGYGAYVVPAVLILVLQQTLLIGAGIAGGTRREQQRPTPPQDQTLSAAMVVFGPMFTTVGRALPYLALYAVNTWYCIGFAMPFQGYHPRGSALTLALIATPFLLATTMLAFALRGMFRRRETAIQVLLATSLPAVFMAGFIWPTDQIPAWLAFGARLIPTTSAIPAFLRVMRMDASLADIARETTTLWVLVLLYFPFACWSHRESVYTPGDGR